MSVNKYALIVAGVIAGFASMSDAVAQRRNTAATLQNGDHTFNLHIQTLTGAAQNNGTAQLSTLRSTGVALDGTNLAATGISAGNFSRQPLATGGSAAGLIPTVRQGGPFNDNEMQQEFTAAARGNSIAQVLTTDSVGVAVRVPKSSIGSASFGSFLTVAP